MLFKSLFWHLWTTYTHYTYTKFWNSRSFFLLKMRKNPEMQLEKFKIHAKTQLDWFFIISFKKRFRVQSLKRYWIPRRRKKVQKNGAVLWLYWCWQEYFKQLKKNHDTKDQYIPYIKCTDEKKHFSTFHSEIFFIQQHRQCAPNQINKKNKRLIYKKYT